MRKGRQKKPGRQRKAADESARAAVLLGLRQAGGRGATLSELGSRKAGDLRHRAIRALAGEGTILVFGDGREAIAVLASRAPTSEAISGKIDSRASMRRGHVLGRDEIAAWCTAAEIFLLDGAVRSLVKGRRLIPLRHGEAILYTHADSFAPRRSGAGQGECEGGPPHDPRYRISEAYRRLVERDGFGDVFIADLLSEAGIGKDELSAILLDESRSGRAHLGRGDWSLADESKRSAAVTAAGEPHLRVRLVV